MTPRNPPARTLLSDEELRKRAMDDPGIQERLEEAIEQARQPSTERGISEEELPDFLREHG